MSVSGQSRTIRQLREQIQSLDGTPLRAREVLPFGVSAIDDRLPGGGLTIGALHEVAGGGNAAIDGAAAALFTAGIAARTKGKVLWCVTRHAHVHPLKCGFRFLAGLKTPSPTTVDGVIPLFAAVAGLLSSTVCGKRASKSA